jgi:hypothetical protein
MGPRDRPGRRRPRECRPRHQRRGAGPAANPAGPPRPMVAHRNPPHTGTSARPRQLPVPIRKRARPAHQRAGRRRRGGDTDLDQRTSRSRSVCHPINDVHKPRPSQPTRRDHLRLPVRGLPQQVTDSATRHRARWPRPPASKHRAPSTGSRAFERDRHCAGPEPLFGSVLPSHLVVYERGLT